MEQNHRASYGDEEAGRPLIGTGVLGLIGRTPVVELARSPGARVLAKLEGLNPGGSCKDRVAHSLVRDAIDRGTVRPGGTIVESSSGNLAIGLAFVAPRFGIGFRCVIDSTASPVTVKLLRALGAEVTLVDEPDEFGSHQQSRRRIAGQLASTLEGACWPDQYENAANPAAYDGLAAELLAQVPHMDAIVVAVGTGGMATGLTDALVRRGREIPILAVDAVGSLTFGQSPARRLLTGFGASFVPTHAQPDRYAGLAIVSDAVAIWHARAAARRAGLPLGGSGGAALAAALDLAEGMRPDQTVVVIVPDRGERYVDTVFSDAWVLEHGLDEALGTERPGGSQVLRWNPRSSS